MRFGLIGDHPDGRELALELARRPDFTFAAYAGPVALRQHLLRQGFDPEFVPEVEEMLARTEIELIIAADTFEFRPQLLRRAVQSEKHVACVHPVDDKPDAAYEAAMIQRDTGKLLWPILPGRFAAGFQRLAALARSEEMGRLEAIEVEQSLPASDGQTSSTAWDGHPLTSIWDGIRLLTGDLSEIVAFGGGEKLSPTDALSLNGRSASGAMIRVQLLPPGPANRCRWRVRGKGGEVEWQADGGLFAASTIVIRLAATERTESLAAAPPWPSLADALRATLAGQQAPVEWTDAVRCLEVFDAVAESVRRQRIVPLHYQDFTEASSFKGLMTIAGCGIVWIALVLLIIAPWVPKILWAIPAMLAAFLLAQGLRWAISEDRSKSH